MAYRCNFKEVTRKLGHEPDRLYNQESKPARKRTNRQHRKASNQRLRVAVDFDALLLPPFPATEGRITI